MFRPVIFLTSLLGLAFAATCFAQPLVLLEDDFNDNSIDPQKWDPVTTGIPQCCASVEETGGRIQMTGRGHLNTAMQFDPNDPAVGGLRIMGTWEYGPNNDFMQILTRSDGTPGGSFGETNNGIEVFAFRDANEVLIQGKGGASVTGGDPVPLPGGINSGDAFDFMITDDGFNLQATLTEVGDSSNTATVSATSSFAPADNLITFHNREGSSQVSFLDDVRVESLTLQQGGGGGPGGGAVPEPASIAIWSLIGLGLAAVGYFRILRNK